MKLFCRGMLMFGLLLAGAFTVRAADADQAKLDAETKDAIALFKKTDADLQKLFEQAYGYAVLPGVTKGGVGIGAAHGEGEVFQKGKLIGTVTLTQITIGAQLGGQEYSEVIFFETKETFDDFCAGKTTMSAQASGVAAAEGASTNAKYQQGVLIFTVAKTGLMGEASVGGQKFKFTPLATK